MDNKIIIYGNCSYKIWSRIGGGQSTKTINIAKVLQRTFGNETVDLFNIEDWKKHPFSLLFRFRKKLNYEKTVVILPGPNNLRFIVPYLAKRKKKLRLRVFYAVVGGFLADSLMKYPKLYRSCQQLDGIYVETIGLQKRLQAMGLHNVFYSPVFSLKSPLSVENLNASTEWVKNHPISFCTFSRVTKEKGIALAINALSEINKNRPVGNKYILHIFGGNPSDDFKAEFYDLLEKNKDFVVYDGFVADEEVIPSLSHQYALLFPTYYYGEGFPASLLEGYMAGLPIIASDWRYNQEIVHDGVTGYLASMTPDGTTNLKEIINKAIESKDAFIKFRKNAYKEAFNFLPEAALKPLIDDVRKTMQ